MAVCPRCETEVPVSTILFKALYCPNCDAKLGFDKREYRKVTRPGIYIALLVIANVNFMPEAGLRIALTGFLLVLWFVFFSRYINYLRRARLEERH